jgi:hypothetical protein
MANLPFACESVKYTLPYFKKVVDRMRAFIETKLVPKMIAEDDKGWLGALEIK